MTIPNWLGILMLAVSALFVLGITINLMMFTVSVMIERYNWRRGQ